MRDARSLRTWTLGMLTGGPGGISGTTRRRKTQRHDCCSRKPLSLTRTSLGLLQGSLLLTAEDIGRHTAVDKVIGKALLSGIDPGHCVLFCSGRLSSEITAKAIHARTPVLVSRAAPTDLSVRLARRFLLTLVGFARGKRMNVYSVVERITD